MSKRSAKFVAALFVSVLAGANLATVTDLRAQAATTDDCLTAPKGGATPAGSHWYYRIDRATKRQCWYLREDGDKASDKSTRATAPVSPPATSAAAAEPAEQQPRTITRKAISDARAEWISQRSRAEPSLPANPGPQTTGAATSTPTIQDGKRTIGANVLAPTPLASTRWFDGSGVNASSNPADVRAAAVADPPADQQQDAEPVQQPALQQPALQQPAPGIALAAADASTAKPTASLQMLLLVMAAALALAGITVSLVFRLGRIRARRAMQRQRRAMWDSVKTTRSAPQTRSAPPIRSAPPTFHREEAARRGAPKLRTLHARKRRVRARKTRGSGRLPTCWPGSPAARSANWKLRRNAVAAIFPAGAAGCERTRSGRCGARA